MYIHKIVKQSLDVCLTKDVFTDSSQFPSVIRVPCILRTRIAFDAHIRCKQLFCSAVNDIPLLHQIDVRLYITVRMRMTLTDNTEHITTTGAEMSFEMTLAEQQCDVEIIIQSQIYDVRCTHT